MNNSYTVKSAKIYLSQLKHKTCYITELGDRALVSGYKVEPQLGSAGCSERYAEHLMSKEWLYDQVNWWSPPIQEGWEGEHVYK